jgi:hypothetical protein
VVVVEGQVVGLSTEVELVVAVVQVLLLSGGMFNNKN